ncbi:PREDICTED: uncharacterized protein LOC108776178 [Cyphomyrmex costatus]|uniref:uncharacterized protein LOC108776178 n=1 Tax=Cyphomyrmex costatus TaxID=456900 RepID=UPI00085239BE|nr:PREDICTED: uncharacterized protein LOC108776178 [Cyphomyrmex costatus]
MLFYLLLIAASPFLIIAIQQNSDDTMEIVQVDNNSPMAYGQFNGQESEVTSRPICNYNEQFDKCMGSCPIILLYDPICGTDEVTYVNKSGLKCAQCCGKEITIKHRGNCTESATE